MRMVEYILPSCLKSMSCVWGRRLLIFLVASCPADTPASATVEDPPVEATWAYRISVVRKGCLSTPSLYEGFVCGSGRDTRRISLHQTDCVSLAQGRSDPQHLDVLVKGDTLTALTYSTTKGWERFTPRREPLEKFSPADDQKMSDMLTLAMHLTPLAHPGASPADAPDIFLSFFVRASAEQQVEVVVPPSWDPNGGMEAALAVSAKTYLSRPPAGRVLRKATLPDGTLRWEMQEGASGDLLVGVQMQPTRPPAKPFDANSIGTGTLVPVQYWRYWECIRAFLTLPKERQQRPAAATALVQRINNSLREVSRDTLRQSLLDVLLQTAIASGDQPLLCASIRTYAAEVRGPDRSLDETLAGLARMTSVLGSTVDDPNVIAAIRPHLEQAIGVQGISNRHLLRYILTQFDRAGAYSLRFMAVDIVRKARSIDERALDRIVEPLEIARLSQHIERSDPTEATQSMRDLMAQRGSPLVRGDLPWTQLETLVADGCAKHLARFSSEDRDGLVKGILDYVSQAVGPGPYRQQRPALEKGLSRFLTAHAKGPLGRSDLPSLLGALLALSFYDTSTPDDHSLLLTQIQSIWDETEAELRKALEGAGMTKCVPDETWERISQPVIARIADYTEDPLWPMFKYPLSRNELCRLRNTMRDLAMNYEASIHGLSKRLAGESSPPQAVDRLTFEIQRVLYRLPAKLVDLRMSRKSPIGYRLLNENLLLVYGAGPTDQRPKEDMMHLYYLYLGHRTEDLAVEPQARRNASDTTVNVPAAQ